MTQVQTDWEQGQRDAVEHEPRLARKYEESLRAHGRAARDRYLASAAVTAAAFDESKHPRHKKGEHLGGQFTTKGGVVDPRLSKYIEQSFDLNAGLRGLRDLTPEEQAQAAAIDALFKEKGVVLKDPITVYRGIPGWVIEDGLFKPGETLVDPAFMSTSLDPLEAEPFADGGVILEVKVPAGTTVLPVGEKFDLGYDQQEVILPKGSSVEPDGDGLSYSVYADNRGDTALARPAPKLPASFDPPEGTRGIWNGSDLQQAVKEYKGGEDEKAYIQRRAKQLSYPDPFGLTAANRPLPGVTPQELVPEKSFKESITAKTKSARTAITKAVGSAILKSTPEKARAIPKIDAFMTVLAAAQAQYAYEAVQDMLASIILDAYEQGWSVDETADQILEVSNDWARWQAQRLARTDLVALANESSLQSVKSMESEDQPKYKIWLTAQDDRVRPTHVGADRQAVELDGSFVVGTEKLRYPGDPNADPAEIMNCRCTIVYSDVPSPQLSYSPDPSEEELAMAAAGGNPYHEPKGKREGGRFAHRPGGVYSPQPDAQTDVRITELKKLHPTDNGEIALTLVDEDEAAYPGGWESAGLDRNGATSEYLYEIEQWEKRNGVGQGPKLTLGGEDLMEGFKSEINVRSRFSDVPHWARTVVAPVYDEFGQPNMLVMNIIDRETGLVESPAGYGWLNLAPEDEVFWTDPEKLKAFRERKREAEIRAAMGDDGITSAAGWNAALHPRHEKGEHEGGQFAPKDGTSSATAQQQALKAAREIQSTEDPTIRDTPMPRITDGDKAILRRAWGMSGRSLEAPELSYLNRAVTLNEIPEEARLTLAQVLGDVGDEEFGDTSGLQRRLGMVAAAVDHTDGCMICLYPVDPEPLAQPGGQPPEDLHITLAFLPNGVDGDEVILHGLLSDIAAMSQVLTGQVSGVGFFAPGDDGVPIIAIPSVVGLNELRTAVVSALQAVGVTYANNWGYNPHITLEYLGDEDSLQPPDVIGVPLEFRGIYLVKGANALLLPFAEDA